jgi:nucleoside 2-deoxyribosyltransferase
MAFKVFLSYGADTGEQLAAWRLQTLATAYGMHVSVPVRNGTGRGMSSQDRRALDQSDCVLAIITGNIGPAVAGELNYALARGKVIVAFVREGIALPPALAKVPVFQFSTWNVGEVEAKVVEFLKQQKLSKENLQSMAVFILAGLGVFLLASLAEK